MPERRELGQGVGLASASVQREGGEFGDPFVERSLGPQAQEVRDGLDVFAELDAPRRRRLTASVADSTQVLITAAVSEDVPVELVGRRLMVTKGAVADA